MSKKFQDKKYQVFVSSTYTDLIEERKKVIDVLLSTSKCIPVGMELFRTAYFFIIANILFEVSFFVNYKEFI
jgi:hypothetical protein